MFSNIYFWLAVIISLIYAAGLMGHSYLINTKKEIEEMNKNFHNNNPYTTYGRASNHTYNAAANYGVNNKHNNTGHGYASSAHCWAKSYNGTWASGVNLTPSAIEDLLDDPFYCKEPEKEVDTLLENKYEAQPLEEMLKPRRK